MGKLRKGRSLFQLIDCEKFDAFVEKWGVDAGVRALSTSDLVSGLLNCLLLRLGSLREAEAVLGVSRTTLSDAMAARCSGFFQELCDEVLRTIRGRTEDRKVKRAVRELLAIDSSEIDVHGSMFGAPGWAKKRGEGKTAAGKLHLVWNVDKGWIEDFSITPGRSHDAPAAKRLALAGHKLYVFDRAYNECAFWAQILEAGSHFVTRLKAFAPYKILEARVLASAKGKDGVLYEGEYVPGGKVAPKHRETLNTASLRHVIYRDPASKRVFHFVSSDPKLAADQIAAVYKRRWAVELLFRWLKGHLDARRLPLKNANAIEVQLAVRVLLQLLLRLKQIIEKFAGTLWELLRQVRTDMYKRGLGGGAPAGIAGRGPPAAGLKKRAS